MVQGLGELVNGLTQSGPLLLQLDAGECAFDKIREVPLKPSILCHA